MYIYINILYTPTSSDIKLKTAAAPSPCMGTHTDSTERNTHLYTYAEHIRQKFIFINIDISNIHTSKQ